MTDQSTSTTYRRKPENQDPGTAFDWEATVRPFPPGVAVTLVVDRDEDNETYVDPVLPDGRHLGPHWWLSRFEPVEPATTTTTTTTETVGDYSVTTTTGTGTPESRERSVQRAHRLLTANGADVTHAALLAVAHYIETGER